MNIKTLIGMASLLLLMSSYSAIAATFNISTASGFSLRNTSVTAVSGSRSLIDGQTSSFVSVGSITTEFLAGDNGLFRDDPVSQVITVQSGGETVTETGSFELSTYNRASSPGAIGATGTLFLVSDLEFDFSFGQLTLLSGLWGNVNCLGCDIGETKTRSQSIRGMYTEISAVPLPTGLPMMLGGLGLLALIYRKKKQA